MTPSANEEGTLAALRGCPLLRSASASAVERMAASADVRSAEKGDILLAQGGPARRFGVVVTGQLLAYHIEPSGRRLLYDTLGPSQAVAAVAVLSRGRYPAWIEAAAPSSVAWLPGSELFSLMASEAAVASDVTTDLASRVVELTGQVRMMSQDVPTRLAGFLFQRALETGRTTAEGLRIDLGMTKAELASAMGTVPETLSRALRALRERDVISTPGKDVVVHDVGALARIGSGYAED